jgi:hypothetical protein
VDFLNVYKVSQIDIFVVEDKEQEEEEEEEQEEEVIILGEPWYLLQ